MHRHYASLDSHSLGPEVSWAHPGPAPMWAHMAREYTERWHHQMQIREAVGIELLLQPMFFRPVLATFVHALPRTYSNLTAKAGTVVRLSVLGESGDDWYLVRGMDARVLNADVPVEPDAQIIIGQEDAWKLFTRSLSKEEVRLRVRLEGDEGLALKALGTVSIIA